MKYLQELLMWKKPLNIFFSEKKLILIKKYIMNYWKITNLSNQNAKLIVSTASNHSKGLILRPGEFCISKPKQTPVMDAQIRRKLIQVDKDFNNNEYQFKLGEAYNLEMLNNISSVVQEVIQEDQEDKMKIAKIDADNYMNNPE